MPGSEAIPASVMLVAAMNPRGEFQNCKKTGG